MEQKITYFENPGPANTEQTHQIARKRAAELGIKTVVVASTSGETGVKAVDALKGLKVVVVSHSFGLSKPNAFAISDANRKKIEAKGGCVLTTTHSFLGMSQAMVTNFNTVAVGDIIANTLRTICQGLKVAVEMTMMAADAGLVRTDEDIIVIAGSGSGSDTALVLTPVNSQNFFSLKIKEILCKPHF